MNYNGEHFPENIADLIIRCDEAVNKIQSMFSKPDCLIVKDLYHSDKGHRQNDFISKLQVTCNTKKDKNSKKLDEVKGIYVFGELQENNTIVPIYVGISRTVFRRLYQHVWRTKHNETSFSYLKAKHFSGHIGLRADLPFELLKIQQDKIKDYRLIVIPVENDYDMYFMEVYIAGKLRTKWNSFKTH